MRRLTIGKTSGVGPDECMAGELLRCILLCQKSVARIQDLTAKVESTIGKTNLLGRLRLAVEEKDLLQLCTELERAKSSLALAYQLYES